MVQAFKSTANPPGGVSKTPFDNKPGEEDEAATVLISMTRVKKALSIPVGQPGGDAKPPLDSGRSKSRPRGASPASRGKPLEEQIKDTVTKVDPSRFNEQTKDLLASINKYLK